MKKATPKAKKKAGGANSTAFYKSCLHLLNRIGLPYMVGGTYAMNTYTGANRKTRDLDIFVRASDYPQVMNEFRKAGFRTTIMDERWLAKVKRGRYLTDIIFNGANAVSPVTDEWFKESRRKQVLGVQVAVLPPTEFVWSKVFVANRHRYDGNDVAHLILKTGKNLDWKRLLAYADQYWEVLLIHLLRFRFIYPSERDLVPRWLLDELLSRLQHQRELKPPRVKVCRGRVFSLIDFTIDITEWGFADVIGDPNEKSGL